MRIVHCSSAHPRYDIRIFLKQCITLAKAGHEVTYIVSDGLGQENTQGVRIYDVGIPGAGRWTRMTRTVQRVYQAVSALRPDVIHFHDPELIPAAMRLKRTGVKVIYDVHEDVPRQILAKHWIPFWLRPTVSHAISVLENYAVRQFDAIVTATPCIHKRFLSLNREVVTVCNYPILDEWTQEVNWDERQNEVCYIGSISRMRGIQQIIAALPDTDVRLNLAGSWSEPDLHATLTTHPGWTRVNELGAVDRAGIVNVLARSKIGLVTLLPAPNHVEALPIKLFEYMAAGLPVIASDFPLWRSIVESTGCGLLVNPEDPAAIASALNYFMHDEVEAAARGRAGQRAVRERYHWTEEGTKLIALYQRLADTF